MGENTIKELYDSLSKVKNVGFNLYSQIGNMGTSGVLYDVSVKLTPASIIITDGTKEEVSVIISIINECNTDITKEIGYIDIKYTDTPLAISLVLM